jgi:hypothetical protein
MRWLKVFARAGFLEFVVFLLLFRLLGKGELLRNAGCIFGGQTAGSGECLRGLVAGLVIKQLSTPAFYGSECWQGAGRVEVVMSGCHDSTLPRF